MKYIILFCFQFIFVFYTKAQISLSTNLINFPETFVGSKDSIKFYIYNDFEHSIYIDSLIFDNTAYSLSKSSFTIAAKDSITLTMYFEPKQNVSYNSFALLKSDNNKVLPIQIIGIGKYADIYNNFTFDLYDENLKNALNQYVENHTPLGYKIARQKMFETIDDLGGDTIECVYTGRKIKTESIPDVNIFHFNTEHTWPQETFDSQEPMRSDLFNLYPSDEFANAKRANYPFGFVISDVVWEVGGSKLGKDVNGKTVFEPRDQHKGNAARSLFYFIIRYPQNYGHFLDSVQESVLRTWNKLDLVDPREIQRNDSISLYQGKRNPFIDHPEFVDRIVRFWSNFNRPKKPQLAVFSSINNLDTFYVNNRENIMFALCNFGDTSFYLGNVSCSNSEITIANFPRSISKHSFGLIELQLNPKNAGIIEGTLVIEGEGEIIEKQLKFFVINPTNSNSEHLTDQIVWKWNNFDKAIELETKDIFQTSTSIIIFNTFGQCLFNSSLQKGMNKIYLNEIAKGLYFAILLKNGKILNKMPIFSY